MIDALVLAGSPNNGSLRACSTASYEALITIGGKLMVEYVITALRACTSVNRIVIVGPREQLARHFQGDERIILADHGQELTENVLRGLEQLPGASRVLLVASDIPLITTQALEDFIQQCQQEKADLCYPIVPREVVEKRYAQSNRTYVTLKDGIFTGGNIFMFDPGIVGECIPKGQKLVAARKSPLKLCRLVGFMFLIRFVMKSVSLQEAQKKVSRLLGVRGRAVISMYPEVGVDVDKPSDLRLVNEQMDLA